MNKKLFENINRILMEWDPIKVEEMGGPLATEYFQYIPPIIQHSNNMDNLIGYMEKIAEELSSGYDKNNSVHKNDMMVLCSKIMSAVSEVK